MKSKPGSQILTWDIFNKHPITVGLTTRVGGFSPPPYSELNLATHTGDSAEIVKKNRATLLKVLNIEKSQYIYGTQVHGDRVVEINSKNISTIYDCDAFITREPNLLLNIFVADCVPIVIYDKWNHTCGICHCGWKGTYKELLIKTIEKMKNLYNSETEHLMIGIGASIGLCCYEVSEELYKDFKPSNSEGLIKDGSYYLDLKRINYNQAIKMGIKSENLAVIDLCTACNTELFYSHRKEGEPTGRFSGFIHLNP